MYRWERVGGRWYKSAILETVGAAASRESEPDESADKSVVTGEPGEPGEDGASAYEIAVANGFSGTEEEWLASLVGPAGADGEDAHVYTGTGEPPDPSGLPDKSIFLRHTA